MAYLGTKPQSGFISQEANQYFTGLTQNYIDLNQSINSLSSVIILVNGVVQENSTLTLTSSSRITLGATLVSADKVTCIYLAKISSTQAPATGTVTLDMLSASGTKSSSTFLRGDNTFASAGLSNWSENSGNLLPSNASYGIYLGVNSATSSNLLHDYEEGELTNALMIGSTTQTSYSSGRANLQYTKIGRIVHCQALLDTDGQTLGATGVVKLRLPFATSDGSGTAMAGGTPFISPSVNGAIFPSRLYLDENVTSAPMNKIQSKGNGNYAEFGEQASVSSTSHRIYIHVCFSYQTDA